MTQIKFSKPELEMITSKIQLYFREELDQDIGQFDAQFLLEFFAEEIGGSFYNRGLHDAQALLSTRLEEISDALYELEKPVNFSR